MAHEVSVTLHTKNVVNKDLEIEVKTVTSGKAEKLGTLLISKGNIEWVKKGYSVRKKKMTWTEFAEMMEENGKPTKGKTLKKKPTVVKPKKAPQS